MAMWKYCLIGVLTLLSILVFQTKGQAIIGFDGTSSSQRPLALSKYTGVAYLDPVACSGTLLPSGQHILTAAHCVNDENSKVPPGLEMSAIFQSSRGMVTIPVAQFYVYPKWTGNESDIGGDLAVLKLARPAPPRIERYELYRDTDEVGQVFTKVGYGYIGTGQKGQDEHSNSEALRHAGQNRYDALIDVFKPAATETDFSKLILGGQLVFDFDNGKPRNDAFGRHFPGLADLGLGRRESATGNGDSGGPSFIRGKVAAVSSWATGAKVMIAMTIVKQPTKI